MIGFQIFCLERSTPSFSGNDLGGELELIDQILAEVDALQGGRQSAQMGFESSQGSDSGMGELEFLDRRREIRSCFL